MTDNRKAGIALIAGSIGAMVTMAIHPIGGGNLTADQVMRLENLSGVAHSLGMISVLILFLGACGLTRRIAGADRLAFSGLVVEAFAVIAVLIAAAVSGFIVPGIMRQMVRDSAAAAPQWRIAIASIFQINQAFSRIYSVAASAAIVLWSVSSLRNGGLSRFVGIYGCVVAPLVAALVIVGHLRMNVHGFAAVVLSQAIWYVVAGVEMCRKELPPVLG
jgi:hypothetical protein